MTRATFTLTSKAEREKVASWAWKAAPGSRVEFKEVKRSLDQNAKMWVLLTEISQQLDWHGQTLRPDDWKLIFIDALKRANGEILRIVPNTDSTGFVNLSTSSSDLSKFEMMDLLELIMEFGARHGVTFNEPEARAA